MDAGGFQPWQLKVYGGVLCLALALDWYNDAEKYGEETKTC